MKSNKCKMIDFDCIVNDTMCASEEESILTDEGYEILSNKYNKELYELFEDMAKDWGVDGKNNESETKASTLQLEDTDPNRELPF